MSDESVVVVDHVAHMERSDEKSELTIYYVSNGVKGIIQFPRNVISDILHGFMASQKSEPHRPMQTPTIFAQRFDLFDQDHTGPQKLIGLAFHLKGGFVFPIVIPQPMLPALRKAVADLELLAADPAGMA